MTTNKKLNSAVNSAVNWAKKYLDCDGTLKFTFEGVKYSIKNQYNYNDIIMAVDREDKRVATFQYSFETSQWLRVI